jgi:hypothetical protein
VLNQAASGAWIMFILFGKEYDPIMKINAVFGGSVKQVNRVLKFSLLPPTDKVLYVTITVLLITVKYALFLFSFRRIQDWTKIDVGQKTCITTDLEEIYQIVDAIERIGDVLSPLQINCLPKAFVGDRLLRRKGYDVQLKIGVRKDRLQRLIAHAWLEHDGRVILGDLANLGQYAPFPGLEGTKH